MRITVSANARDTFSQSAFLLITCNLYGLNVSKSVKCNEPLMGAPCESSQSRSLELCQDYGKRKSNPPKINLLYYYYRQLARTISSIMICTVSIRGSCITLKQ